MLRILRLRTAAVLLALCCILAPSGNVASAWQEGGRSAPFRFDGTLSVLTYNVKGLPWPLAGGRDEAFDAMAQRLLDMRAEARNPQIVVLQEAFTREAQAIGRRAGYRYVVYGPAASETVQVEGSNGDRLHRRQASWWKGESGAKLLGSGLQILSDYPVLSVRSMAFPDFACAGYDCLSNKGAVMVTVRMPGAPSPVDIVTTHLNCRRKSGVGTARSLYAYRRQADFLAGFVAENRSPDHPLILAGDFNVGKDAERRDWLLRTLGNNLGDGGVVADALRQVAAAGGPLPADALSAMRKAKDWQFYAGGGKAALVPQRIEVPFGTERDGGMLSDHVGYTAVFRLLPAA